MHGFVVMPDHVHLVFTPLADANGPISLPEIFQKMKSESSHRINNCSGGKAESGGTSPLIMFFDTKKESMPSSSTSA